MEELQGGELAARLTAAQRMDMVMSGYNPLSPTDFERYTSGKKPAEGLHEIAGVTKYKNLGMSSSNTSKDDALIQKQFGEGTFDENDLESSNTNSYVNPREAIQNQMENYSSTGTADLNSKLMSRIERRQINEQPIRNNKQFVQAPNKQKKTLITESKQAKKIGYTLGIKYINAFIKNLKNPSAQTRDILIKEMNNLVLVESKIHPKLLKEYRFGIAYAEKELYRKIVN
jgi:hypothetical protein